MRQNIFGKALHGFQRCRLPRADVEIHRDFINTGFGVHAETVDHLISSAHQRVIGKFVQRCEVAFMFCAVFDQQKFPGRRTIHPDNRTTTAFTIQSGWVSLGFPSAFSRPGRAFSATAFKAAICSRPVMPAARSSDLHKAHGAWEGP